MNKARRSNLLQFSLFDSTALSAPLGTPSSLREQVPVPENEVRVVPSAPKALVARNFRLSGDRALAPTWKGRAADNLAAIRLLREIEDEDRPMTADEQAQLARFTGFGASELANTLFRRTGEAFRPGWEDMGTDLEQMVSPAELAGLMRSTQYAHYTPEFLVRAMWATLTRMGPSQAPQEPRALYQERQARHLYDQGAAARTADADPRLGRDQGQVERGYVPEQHAGG